jgi:hypothetical protein
MSQIYEIIDSLNLEEKKTNKIQINLINNPEKEERLLLALKNKTDDAKKRFLESFLETIPGMLDKISAVILFVTLRLNFFFVLYHVPVNLDERLGKPLRRNDWSTRT